MLGYVMVYYSRLDRRCLSELHAGAQTGLFLRGRSRRGVLHFCACLFSQHVFFNFTNSLKYAFASRR